jgi:hypothetical protein
VEWKGSDHGTIHLQGGPKGSDDRTNHDTSGTTIKIMELGTTTIGTKAIY